MRPLDSGDLEALALLAGASILAGFVRGFAGFGGPATLTLMLANLFTPATLLPKVAVVDFCSYPSLLLNVRRDVHWRFVVALSVPVMAMVPVGVLALPVLDPALLKRAIGVVSIASVAVLMAGWRLSRPTPAPVVFPIGLALGFVLGTTYIALPAMAFILMQPFDATRCRATIIVFSVFLGPIYLGAVLVEGLLRWGDVLPLAAVGLVYLGTANIGARVFRRAGERGYRHAAHWLLLVLAATALL
ncbi:MAG: sulfite exporter TauE/SafE family protein [Ectothiorhodospiraceae bacterium]|nr:sulfite exporter TauE/SafE family protein [Ectothiorhodospiraceae bacterium]